MNRFSGKELVRALLLQLVRRRLDCIFVLSTGRTGTDTLAHLLNLSPDVVADHEPRPWFRRASKAAYQEGRYPSSIARDYLNARLFSSRASSQLGQAFRNRMVFVETANRLTYLAPALAEYFPRSRFIFLHRDPASIVRSAMRRGYYRNNPWDPYRIVPGEGNEFHSDWQNKSPFEKCCWYWNAVNEFSLDFMDTLPSQRRFVLSSESLFEGEPANIDSLFSWMGVPVPPRGRVLEVIAQKLNRQQSGDFPVWGHWTQSQQDAMWSIVEPVASRLGYRRPDELVQVTANAKC